VRDKNSPTRTCEGKGELLFVNPFWTICGFIKLIENDSIITRDGGEESDEEEESERLQNDKGEKEFHLSFFLAEEEGKWPFNRRRKKIKNLPERCFFGLWSFLKKKFLFHSTISCEDMMKLKKKRENLPTQNSNKIMMINSQFIPLLSHNIYVACFLVHSRATASYRGLSVLYKLAISGTRGSSGLGSQRREQIDRRSFEIVRAGLHLSFKMSKQIPPLELMFG
jgi:hypothetical protein